MKHFATWKYVVLVLAIVFGALYAAPNLYGKDPSVQVTLDSGEPVPADLGERLATTLAEGGLEPLAIALENGRWIVRWGSPEEQLKAADLLKDKLGRDYAVALDLAAKTPAW